MYSERLALNDAVNGSRCSHRLLSAGVHEFNFHESTRAAVNEWIEGLETLLNTADSGDVLSLVVDTRQSGTLPLGYLIGKLRNVFRKYDHRPSMRLALLSESSALMVFVQLLAEIAATGESSKVQYHQSPTEADALEWLLAS